MQIQTRKYLQLANKFTNTDMENRQLHHHCTAQEHRHPHYLHTANLGSTSESHDWWEEYQLKFWFHCTLSLSRNQLGKP